MVVGADSGVVADAGVENRDTQLTSPCSGLYSTCMAALHIADWSYTRSSPWPASHLLPWFRVISLVCLRFP